MLGVMEAVWIEEVIADLFSNLLMRGATALFRGHSERFDPALGWIHMRSESGNTVGLRWGERRSSSALFLRLGAAARSIGAVSALKSWAIAAGFENTEPAEAHEFEVLFDGEKGVPVWFARQKPLSETILGGVGRVARTIAASARAVVSVSLYGAAHRLERGAPLFLRGAVLAPVDRAPLAARIGGFKDGFIVIGEETMVKRPDEHSLALAEIPFHAGVAVTVDIGGFEMSLEDLFSLRPGVEIALPCGPVVRGVVKLFGAEVAYATLNLERTGLTARIEELVGFPRSEKNSFEGRNGESSLPITEYPPINSESSGEYGRCFTGEHTTLRMEER